MRNGFLRVAACTPMVSPGAVEKNVEQIVGLMKQASARCAKLLVLPELSITGCSCRDLFRQTALASAALSGLALIVEESRGLDLLVISSLPLRHEGALYLCAVCVKDGEILGVVPKRHPSAEQMRHFTPGKKDHGDVLLLGRRVPMGTALRFACEQMPEFSVSVAMGEDWPSSSANVIAWPASHIEMAGSPGRIRNLLSADSQRHACGIVMASAGASESTTDAVYGGRRMIYEKGDLLAETAAFATGLLMTELDVGMIDARRCAAQRCVAGDGCAVRTFSVQVEEIELERSIDPSPFVPRDEGARAERFEQILGIQTEALARRMMHIRAKTAVVGVSGGLDSTLTMIVSARAVAQCGLPQECLSAITMPCFGTTDRTKRNARRLTEALGGSLREISIAKSVMQHFEDIGHDIDTHDVTYENAQARERTQVLMDVANMEGGLVVGTGDLSELALGWATYNGDHMSMYGTNAGIPKTLMRHIVRHVAETAQDEMLRACLMDILDTPVSPELLPPDAGKIAQKTEELVGPYALHDFFLYHMLGGMQRPAKIRRLALRAFEGTYGEAEIDHWLRTFIRRFFSQQFKRNCLPEGPMVGSITLSPRGGFSMPSDADFAEWLKDLP